MLWLAVFRDVRGGACGSSNQRVGAHRCAQLERRCYVCQDCVHSAGINIIPAGDRVTASLDSRLLLYCVVSLIVLCIFACDRIVT